MLIKQSYIFNDMCFTWAACVFVVVFLGGGVVGLCFYCLFVVVFVGFFCVCLLVGFFIVAVRYNRG